jgi:hypothetical protein
VQDTEEQPGTDGQRIKPNAQVRPAISLLFWFHGVARLASATVYDLRQYGTSLDPSSGYKLNGVEPVLQ